MQNSLATAREILLHEVGSGTALQIFHLAVLAGEKTTGQREVTHHADLLFLCQIRQLRFKIIPIMQVVQRLRSEERRVGKECSARWWRDEVRHRTLYRGVV